LRIQASAVCRDPRKKQRSEFNMMSLTALLKAIQSSSADKQQ
jgi:hypothetical protein